MMWIEACFSSLLLFSAIIIASSYPHSADSGVSSWAEYSHLNNAAAVLSAELSSATMLPSGLQVVADEATEPSTHLAPAASIAAADAVSAVAEEAQFHLAAQQALDYLTLGTPYCLELAAKNYPLHAVSCSGSPPSQQPGRGISSSFAVERAALHNHAPILYSLRQWTDMEG